MTTIPAGKPLTDIIKLSYAANRPVLLIGSHGLGKSEMTKLAADEMKIGYLCRDLSLMEPPDLVGLPRVDGDRTTYVPPAFLPREGKGLLVIEELNRADRIMQAPCMQLLTTRSLNDYKLPEGWLPIACINPVEDGYDVNELDAALVSRFVKIYLRADVELWMEWAKNQDVHADVIRYAEADKTIFDGPNSSPRSWVYVSDFLKVFDREKNPANVLRAVVNGLIDEKRGAAFLAFRKHPEQPLSVEEVLNRYGSRGAVVRGWVLAGHLDLPKSTMLEIQKHVQPRGKYDVLRANPKQWNNLGRFMADLPADLRDEAIKMFAERGYEIPPLSGTTESAA